MNRQLPIRSLLFAVALAFVSQSVFAQQMRISGRVCDSSGPVIGAVAVVKGTMRGISTDFDGQYVIDVAPGETLVFSYVGLQSVEALEPTYSRNIIKLQTIDNHSLFGVYSKSKSF